MIFLTVGSNQPFDRLVRAVDEWCHKRGQSEVFGQILERGRYGYRPRNFDWVARLSPEEYLSKFKDARFVIAHAGMGSIITAMSLAKPIIVLPRRGHLKETRNDHQYGTVRRLVGQPGIYVAMAEEDLPELLDHVVPLSDTGIATGTLSAFADDCLIKGLRDFIHSGPADIRKTHR